MTLANSKSSAPSRRAQALAWTILLALPLLAACLIAPPADAGDRRVYLKYTDEQGRLHIVQNRNQVPPRYRSQLAELALEGKADFTKADVPPPRLRPRSEFSQPVAKRALARGADPDEVVLYYADWCGYCKKAMRWLDDNGVDYVKRDIDVPTIKRELASLSGRTSIPVLTVDGQLVRGYNPAKYEQLLD